MKNILRWICFIPVSFLVAVIGAGIFYFALGLIDPILSFLSGIEPISRPMLLFITPFAFYYLLLITSYKIAPCKKEIASNLYCTAVASFSILCCVSILIFQGLNEQFSIFDFIKGVIPALLALIFSIFQIKTKQQLI